MTTISTSSNQFFRFNQGQTNTVKVENISPRITINEVVALFNTLIGDVRNSQDCKTSLGISLEITFFNRDAATKAICMSGYNIQGQALVVTPIFSPQTNARPKQQIDDRRNLYVLGLPFALTKSEFANVFSRYGTVVHCVILATVDNSSRRRGFVVMSSHEEAKLVITSLTRTQIKGHTLDISWAVVQRSQGFLDGGDRNMLLDSRSPPRSLPQSTRHGNPEIGDENSSASSIDPAEHDIAAFTLSLVPTPTIFVTNLPAFLFAQIQDMQSLFYPFGHIKKLKILETSPKGSTSALVEYESAGIAQEARETLHGQCYAGQQIAVRFIRSKSSLLDPASVPDPAYYDMNALSTFALSARAPAFSLSPPGFHWHHDSTRSQRFKNSQNTHLNAPHPLSLGYFQRAISRSSSAGSCLESGSHNLALGKS